MLEQKKRKCIDLKKCRTDTTPRKMMCIDDTGQIYEDYSHLEKKIPVEKGGRTY